MRLSFRLGISVACLLLSSIASADDSGWYLGLGLGQSHASQPAPLASQNPDFQIGISTDYKSDSSTRDSTAERLEGGYWFNSHVGLQVSYVGLGEYTHEVSGIASGECQTCRTFGFIESSKVKAQGESLAVTGRLPLSEHFDLTGRVGLFWNQLTYYEDSNQGFQDFFAPATFPMKKTDLAQAAGVSLGWEPREYWEVLLGLDEYFSLGDSMFGTFNMSVVSLGIQYHF